MIEIEIILISKILYTVFHKILFFRSGKRKGKSTSIRDILNLQYGQDRCSQCD